MYQFDTNSQRFVGVPFDDFLGYWYQQPIEPLRTQEKYLIFCFRVGKNKIGSKHIWEINNMKTTATYTRHRRGNQIIRDASINDQSAVLKGVYNTEKQLIVWKQDDHLSFLWVRPG